VLASRPRVRGAVTARAARTGELAFACSVAPDAVGAMDELGAALAGTGLGLGEVVKLNVYYPAQGQSEDVVLGEVADALPARPGPAIGALPLPALTELEPAVRIDAVAAAGERSTTAADGARFASAVRVDDLVWTSAVTAPDSSTGLVGQTEAVLESLRALLGAEDAALDDAVKVNIFYVGSGTAADWEVAARTRGAAVSEPAAAATGVPVPAFGDREALTSIEVWAARGSSGPPFQREHHWPEGHWDWPIHLPWKHGCRCGNLVTVGGQVSLRGSGDVVDPGHLAKQVSTSLANIGRVLGGLDASADDVVRVTAFYERRRRADDELLERALAEAFPRAASLAVPLPCLAYRDMVVEIEAVAVA
jgi:enamine deaminase RidA (YjgF/YER057c/UK114 family)